MRSKWGRVLVTCGILGAAVVGTWACSQGDPTPPFLPDTKKDASVSGNDATSNVDAAGDVVTEAQTTCAFDDGGCNTLLNCGAHVYIVEVSQTASAAQGGVVPDGTYILTDYRVFTGSPDAGGTTTAWFAETMSFASPPSDAGANDAGDSGNGDAGDASVVIQDLVWQDNVASNAYPQSTSLSGIASFSGTNVVITHTCPNMNTFKGTFTMSGTQLVLFVQESAGIGQLTYTKQ